PGRLRRLRRRAPNPPPSPRQPTPRLCRQPATDLDPPIRARTSSRRPTGTDLTQALDIARSRLLLPAGLEVDGLERTFGALLGPGIDFGDIYFQHARRESWTVEDGIVRDGAHAIEQGVGVRAISGEK